MSISAISDKDEDATREHYALDGFSRQEIARRPPISSTWSVRIIFSTDCSRKRDRPRRRTSPEGKPGKAEEVGATSGKRGGGLDSLPVAGNAA